MDFNKLIPNIYHFIYNPEKSNNSDIEIYKYFCIKSIITLNNPDTIYFHYTYLPNGKLCLLKKMFPAFRVDLLPLILLRFFITIYLIFLDVTTLQSKTFPKKGCGSSFSYLELKWSSLVHPVFGRILAA